MLQGQECTLTVLPQSRIQHENKFHIPNIAVCGFIDYERSYRDKSFHSGQHFDLRLCERSWCIVRDLGLFSTSKE